MAIFSFRSRPWISDTWYVSTIARRVRLIRETRHNFVQHFKYTILYSRHFCLLFCVIFKGFLHSPYEIPDVACRIYPSPESHYKTLDVTALSIYSTPEIKFLTPKQRGCRFLQESNLDISPVYTYNMCRIQCRMEQARKLCGCVPYFYKPLSEYSSMVYFIISTGLWLYKKLF